MDLSIVIPAFNEEALIDRTLTKIKMALSYNDFKGFTWEIIVCDNDSTDQTASIAAKAGAIVITEPVRQIAKARNTGASGARGKWLLFIDADTYPTPELVTDVLEVIEGDLNIGCGTTIQVEDGTLFNKLRMERLNPLFRILKFCGGAFLLCHRNAFVAISGFSTNLYAYEEIDFVYRLKRYGRKYGKSFSILHRHPAITSGRKGEFTGVAILRLFASNIAAVVLFILYYLLPGRWIKKVGARLLGYWYRVRE